MLLCCSVTARSATAGDYGFDPLRLAANSTSLPWYVEAERQNGRWAMAAVAGILATELIGAGGNWWTPDASAHVANGAPTARVFGEAAIMAVAESFRLKAFEAGGPGAKAFDPAGMKARACVGRMRVPALQLAACPAPAR